MQQPASRPTLAASHERATAGPGPGQASAFRTSRATRMNARSFGSRAGRRHTSALRSGLIPAIGTNAGRLPPCRKPPTRPSEGRTRPSRFAPGGRAGPDRRPRSAARRSVGRRGSRRHHRVSKLLRPALDARDRVIGELLEADRLARGERMIGCDGEHARLPTEGGSHDEVRLLERHPSRPSRRHRPPAGWRLCRPMPPGEPRQRTRGAGTRRR